jgi:hypothetical protein
MTTSWTFSAFSEFAPPERGDGEEGGVVYIMSGCAVDVRDVI